ncbi:dipeptidyl aminopeptidase/acylaminoacyl peptidase [Granulicella aggregans]|uniref:Dipeptidyl aminopeptidase/acylaminoacyl peptidase n=1 Tax=Granulicella aggregans TaxID=474949 RepID=A0A7W7ZCM1_9BACT|nr:S9 family peptidase [Granulicella aggregans]MBB5056891.1 dipeptidyl aminopeptidase/acylaminoacyl peptidase [Granulicella aggregans]
MRSIATLLLAAASTAVFAQAPIVRRPAVAQHPMTFEDMMRMKRVSDPQISPSGKWVLFSVVDVELGRNLKTSHLWVVPADGSSKEVQLTNGAGESEAKFSPDGTRVVFVAKGQLYLAAWDEKKGRLIPAVELTHIVTEADAPIWSPDGKSLAFTSDVYPECSKGVVFDGACNQKAETEAGRAPTKALVFDSLLYRHWDHFQGAKRSHILMLHVSRAGYIFDLTPVEDWGKDVIAPNFSLGGPTGYAWAPDSKEVAFVLNNDKVPAASTNNDIYTIDVTQHDAQGTEGIKGWSPKKISTSPGSDDGPAYSPDGKFLAFRSQARAGYESDRFRLMLYEREAKSTKEVLPNYDSWVDEFVWTPDSEEIYFLKANSGEESIVKTSLSDILHRTSHLTRDSGEYSDLRLTPDGKGIIASRMNVNRPSEIVSLNFSQMSTEQTELISDPVQSRTPPPARPRSVVKNNELSWKHTEKLHDTGSVAITHENDQTLTGLDLSSMEDFWFHGAADQEVQGFIIRPPKFDPAKKYPLKFLIHGGPQGAWGDAWSYRWNAELMAASGYVVVMINPRGSTGYGQAFIDGVNGDWGGKPYVDLMKGLDYAEAKYPFIDKTRECALGASYGGYMADWILTHTNRFACIVTHDGMFNPQSAYGATEEMWFNEWEFRRPGSSEPGQPWKYASGPVAEDPFRKWSPMLSVQNAKTPTLVIHSQKDYRLDVSEGFQLFTALQRLNVPSKMLYFPDEGHWILKPQNSKLWYETVGDWCDQWTHSGKYAADTVGTGK